MVKFTKTYLLRKIKNLSETGLFFISVIVIFTCTIQQLFIFYPSNFIIRSKKMFHLCNIYHFLIKTFLYLFAIILTFLTLIIFFLYLFFVYWVNPVFTIGVERQVQRRANSASVSETTLRVRCNVCSAS